MSNPPAPAAPPADVDLAEPAKAAQAWYHKNRSKLLSCFGCDTQAKLKDFHGGVKVRSKPDKPRDEYVIPTCPYLKHAPLPHERGAGLTAKEHDRAVQLYTWECTKLAAIHHAAAMTKPSPTVTTGTVDTHGAGGGGGGQPAATTTGTTGPKPAPAGAGKAGHAGNAEPATTGAGAGAGTTGAGDSDAGAAGGGGSGTGAAGATATAGAPTTRPLNIREIQSKLNIAAKISTDLNSTSTDADILALRAEVLESHAGPTLKTAWPLLLDTPDVRPAALALHATARALAVGWISDPTDASFTPIKPTPGTATKPISYFAINAAIEEVVRCVSASIKSAEAAATTVGEPAALPTHVCNKHAEHGNPHYIANATDLPDDAHIGDIFQLPIGKEKISHVVLVKDTSLLPVAQRKPKHAVGISAASASVTAFHTLAFRLGIDSQVAAWPGVQWHVCKTAGDHSRAFTQDDADAWCQGYLPRAPAVPASEPSAATTTHGHWSPTTHFFTDLPRIAAAVYGAENPFTVELARLLTQQVARLMDESTVTRTTAVWNSFAAKYNTACRDAARRALASNPPSVSEATALQTMESPSLVEIWSENLWSRPAAGTVVASNTTPGTAKGNLGKGQKRSKPGDDRDAPDQPPSTTPRPATTPAGPRRTPTGKVHVPCRDWEARGHCWYETQPGGCRFLHEHVPPQPQGQRKAPSQHRAPSSTATATPGHREAATGATATVATPTVT